MTDVKPTVEPTVNTVNTVKVEQKKPTRKPRRIRRRKPKTDDTIPSVEKPVTLKDKLREKLRSFSVARTSLAVRDSRLEDLEDQLERTKNRDEKAKIEKEISLLEDIRNREGDHAGEFPDYGDSASYGGGQERPD